jgi:hypothetical protein
VRWRTDPHRRSSRLRDKDKALTASSNNRRCSVRQQPSGGGAELQAAGRLPAQQAQRHGGETILEPGCPVRRNKMSVGTILLILVVLMLLGAIPTWPHSRGWGYGPSGGLGLVLLVLIVLLVMGRL